jgi:hypothetical protein
LLMPFTAASTLGPMQSSTKVTCKIDRQVS